MTSFSVGELLRVKYKSEDLTSTNASWISPATGNKIVVLSVAWVIEAGTATPTVRFTGDTNYPGSTAAFATTLGEPHQHSSDSGLFESAISGDIGVTITGTTPSVAVSMSYVEVSPTNYVA
jgi:hypothetical protein